jgi:N-dimethylarginine dimethylaminohydrolase
MCPPLHFGVEYVINPWMKGQIHATDRELAERQWSSLHTLLGERGQILSLPAVAGLPDLVFTANAGLVYRGRAVLSSFRCPERRPESSHNAEWLMANGFEVRTLPSGVLFEGAGDALFDRKLNLLWFGHGFRSDIAAKTYLEQFTGLGVQPLRLQDPRFYHLDTCFCPLEGGHLLYYRPAFDEASANAIEARVPPERRMALSDEDAIRFSCNAVNIGESLVVNDASEGLIIQLNKWGFKVITTGLSEFIRAGGAAKCLCLRLDES